MGKGARAQFNAPAEVVFGTLTDPDRAQRWLPPQILVQAPKHRLAVDSGDLRVTVTPTTVDGWTGHVAVRESGAGGSEIEVDLVGQSVPEAEREHADRLIEQALAGLRQAVEENFTAG